MIYAFGCDAASTLALRSAFPGFAEIDRVDGLFETLAEARFGSPTLAFVDFDAFGGPDRALSDGALGGINDRAAIDIPLIGIGSENAAPSVAAAKRLRLIDWLYKPARPMELRLRAELALEAPQRHLKAGLSLLSSLGPNLTFTECRILAEFWCSPDMSASRKSLTKAIWVGLQINPKTLDVHLFNLRKKVGLSGYNIQYNRDEMVWRLMRSDVPLGAP